MLTELRYGLRTLTRSPGFAAIAILTLALGIGASTAIFSVVDAVLLRALPYPSPERIVRVWEQAPDGHRMNFADPNFDDFRAQNETFGTLAQYASALSSVSGGSEPVRVPMAEVSRDFFKALGVSPLHGRTFAPDEQRLHGSPAAIVSHGYWQRYLGGSADLSKFHVTLDGSVYPVVGVMPLEFDFPPGVVAWIPRELDEVLPSRTAHNWQVLGRLRDGVTLAQAHANLASIAGRIKTQYGKDVDLVGAVVLPLRDAMVGNVRTALLTLLAAVGLLLLVACANVAGLLLARTSARRKELAVRVALGAGRSRLVRQFLGEAFALALPGGVLGILVAIWAVRVLPAILPANLPRQQGVAVNAAVLLFAVAATVAVAVALGLFAALRAASGDLREALTAGSRSHSAGRSSQKLRSSLVIGEIAITLVILVGAGLLAKSFLRLTAMSPGFSTENVAVVEFPDPTPRGPDVLLPPIPTLSAMQERGLIRQVQTIDEIVNRVRAIPGVQAVGFTGAIPAAAGDNLADGTFLVLDGQESPKNFDDWGRMARNTQQTGRAYYAVADEQYFKTMGIALVRGRLFGEHDDWNSPNVALISEALASKRWPDQDPIGRTINFGNMDSNLQPLTIVGVVRDVRALGLDQPPPPIVYVAYRQRGLNGNSTPTLLVRASGPPGAIASAARDVFRDLAPDVPVKFSTFGEEMGAWLADRRFLLLLVGTFAAAALVLAAVGIYGIVAFSVARRTQEIGIRMALGARRRDVLRLVVGEGARLAVLGVAIGIAASFVVTRLLASLLFGVGATDPITFAGVAVLLSLVALAASYVPARRAMRLDPNVALRHE